MIGHSSCNSIFSVAAFLATMSVALGAGADVLPPNDCTSSMSAGSECSTAGPDFNQDGICVAATCGGTVHFACFLCELPGPQAGDGGSDGGSEDAESMPVSLDGSPDDPQSPEAGPTREDAGPTSVDSGPTPVAPGVDAGGGKTSVASTSGCSASPASESGGAGLLAGLGALVSVVSIARRRRSREG
jgi:MYXO-CTERM domain-containing protein